MMFLFESKKNSQNANFADLSDWERPENIQILSH
jgi:hypothetical protein